MSETNFDFFTRGGPTERGFTAPAPENQAVVQVCHLAADAMIQCP